MAMTHPTTRISTGELIGRSEDGIERFLGVPYAAAPFGERRFRLPEPAVAWSEPRDAAEFGPAAPQSAYPGRLGTILPSIHRPGDDILTANIWAPEGAESLPVVMWIHGGAFERGGAAIEIYDGTSFAKSGVVFVSINYRLGAEGFSVLEDVPRNLGLEDAAAALRWVHQEIAAFGGDPARITVMGESAGGSLTAALTARADTRPLMAGAIVQSGPTSAEPEAKGAKLSNDLAKRLGVPATRAGFASVTPEAILMARVQQAAGKSVLSGAPSYVLTLDQQSLPITPAQGLIESEMPLVIGANTQEYRLWFAPEALAAISGFKFFLATKAMKISKAAVTAAKQDWPAENHGELLGQLITDRLLRGPAILAARNRQAPSYVYEFAWRTPKHKLGAAHALELGFTFDALQSDDAKMMADSAPQQLADLMHADWVSFIKTGAASWTRFAADEQVRIYDEQSQVVGLPRKQALDALL
ncbi:carboxylesterase family protein [Leucobacter sp. UT-8R-CII-1-4]|uniref:carboxylesterase/lipase family protein n=1 Tax=Leucobacter sp. UT-8R-CII-1-4 TaxID=3040075 RepID=UPI0024A8D564|nr:carboxylesterase family protein [Leucobacter sp. UT-8R-CII-1-4]MDI6022583.1 carboxylesterase family protein [Leucobacter sp. UT-8R-CII-1-4]